MAARLSVTGTTCFDLSMRGLERGLQGEQRVQGV